MLGNVFPERFPTLLSNNIFSNLHQRNNLIQKLAKVRNSITSAQKIQRERNKTYILQTFHQYTIDSIVIDSPGVTRHQGNIAHNDFMGRGSANLNPGVSCRDRTISRQLFISMNVAVPESFAHPSAEVDLGSITVAASRNINITTLYK
jgi:hypothetical protein